MGIKYVIPDFSSGDDIPHRATHFVNRLWRYFYSAHENRPFRVSGRVNLSILVDHPHQIADSLHYCESSLHFQDVFLQIAGKESFGA
jgi:hypothetical protein